MVRTRRKRSWAETRARARDCASLVAVDRPWDLPPAREWALTDTGFHLPFDDGALLDWLSFSKWGLGVARRVVAPTTAAECHGALRPQAPSSMCHVFNQRSADDEKQFGVAPKNGKPIPVRKQTVYNMDDASSSPRGAALRQQQAFTTIKDLARAAARQLSKASGHPVRAKDLAHLYATEGTPQQNAHTDAHRPWRESKKYANASGFVAVQRDTTLQVSVKSHQLLRRLSSSVAPVGAFPLTTLYLEPGDVVFWLHDLVHCGSMYAKRNDRLHWVLSTLFASTSKNTGIVSFVQTRRPIEGAPLDCCVGSSAGSAEEEDGSVHGSSDDEEDCGRATAQINACAGDNALCVPWAPRTDLTPAQQSKELRLARTDVLTHLLRRKEALLFHKPPTLTECSDAPSPGGRIGAPPPPTAVETRAVGTLGRVICKAVVGDYSTTEHLVRDVRGVWKYFSSFEDFPSGLCAKSIAELEPYFEREMTRMSAAL